jgi:hypothetical protein
MGIARKNGATYLFCYGNAIMDFTDIHTNCLLALLQKMDLRTDNHYNNGTYIRAMAQCNNHK